jgi:DNA-binding response OmpR family regulator
LDWGLPKKDGIDILREYRAAGGTVPILILTGKGDVEFRIEGLESGADDYLPKPFSMKELIARVRSILRRPQGVLPDELKVGSLTIHLGTSTVSRDGVEISLLAKEIQVFTFLAKHRGQCFTAQDLLNKVWHSESDSTEDAVRQCLVRLRKKIDKPGEESVIKTLRNLGYTIE